MFSESYKKNQMRRFYLLYPPKFSGITSFLCTCHNAHHFLSSLGTMAPSTKTKQDMSYMGMRNRRLVGKMCKA
jgi:hypothetical protein